jgi:hypothetical protein
MVQSAESQPTFRRKIYAVLATCIRLVSYLAYSSTLKTYVTCSSETSVGFQRTTLYYIPEYLTLHIHSSEILKSCIIIFWKNNYLTFFSIFQCLYSVSLDSHNFLKILNIMRLRDTNPIYSFCFLKVHSPPLWNLTSWLSGYHFLLFIEEFPLRLLGQMPNIRTRLSWLSTRRMPYDNALKQPSEFVILIILEFDISC